MNWRLAIGYALTILGIILTIVVGIGLVEAIKTPPPAGAGLGGAALYALGIALGMLIFMAVGLIFLIPGALLIKIHDSMARPVFGVITLIASIVPIALLAAEEPKSLLATPILLLFHLPASTISISGSGRAGAILFGILFVIAVVTIVLIGF